jgi:hypothetical protein
MPADSTDNTVEQQAIDALRYLDSEEQTNVLRYINSLIKLDSVKDDQRSAAQN